jgi:hypothetical protein
MAEREHAAPVSEYWLARCIGFSVDSEDGRLGSVDEVRSDPRWGEGRILAVRVGRLGRTLLILPLSEIRSIRPRERRIFLPASPKLLGTESRW